MNIHSFIIAPTFFNVLIFGGIYKLTKKVCVWGVDSGPEKCYINAFNE